MKELRRKPRKGERVSIAAIAAVSNAEGRATHTGKPWVPGTVHQILKRA
jgi:hypothetical protein